MAEEPQQKKFEVHSDEHKDRFSGMFPELVDNCTKLRQGSSEIGEAIQHIKLCFGDQIHKLNQELMTVESLEHLQILDTEPTVDQVEDCRAMAEESQQEPKRQWDRYRDQFMSVFPELVDGITKGGLGNPEISDAIQHIKSRLEDAVCVGKLNRGLMVIGSLQHLRTDMDPRVEKLALILGWCVELLQACFQVADDILDESIQSITSWGKQNWCVKDFVGLMLESVVYEILKVFIRQEPYYLQVLELFQEVSYLTKVGRCLETITTPENDVHLDQFTLEKYAAIVKYKTTFRSFYLPVGIAMYMAGICEELAHKNAKDILLQMGELFQVQVDFLDCFGDPAVTGKFGTNIEDNKCTWLVVQALDRATPQQRAILETNYGRKDPECVQRVKDMYKELKLVEAYCDYKETCHAKLIERITTVQPLPGRMFLELLERVSREVTSSSALVVIQ